jgi:hypothetical protein
MSLLDTLKAHPEILRRASETIAEFETIGCGGRWSLEFHHKPGGLLKAIKFVDRTLEFEIKDLR